MRKLLLCISMILSISTLSSQDVDLTTLTEEEVFKLIDTAVDEKDENILSILGSLDSETSVYSKYENYIIDRSGKLIGYGDLDFSLQLIEAVLYNNLENEEAQRLYTVIINKKIEFKERLEAEQIVADKKREEIIILNKEVKEEVVYEEYMANVISTNSELLSVIESYSNSYDRANYITNFYFYPITEKYYTSEVYDGYMNRDSTTNNYSGQGMDLAMGYSVGWFSLRTDLSVSLTYEDLINDTLKQVTGSAILSTGLTAIEIPLFLRSGFLYDLYMYNDDDFSDVAITNLGSPIIGLGLTGFNFLKVLELDIAGDFLLAPAYTDNLDFAFASKLYITVNLFKIGKQNFEIKGGIDTLYLNEEGLSEFSYTPRLGIGISSYE